MPSVLLRSNLFLISCAVLYCWSHIHIIFNCPPKVVFFVVVVVVEIDVRGKKRDLIRAVTIITNSYHRDIFAAYSVAAFSYRVVLCIYVQLIVNLICKNCKLSS